MIIYIISVYRRYSNWLDVMRCVGDIFFANAAGQQHVVEKKGAVHQLHIAGNEQAGRGKIRQVINTSGKGNGLRQKLALFFCSAANDWTYPVDAETRIPLAAV